MKGRRFAKPGSGDAERWLYGVHAVEAWVRSQPQQVRALRIERGNAGASRLREILKLAAASRIPLEEVSVSSLLEITGTRRHQGVAARCAAFPYVEIEDVLETDPWLLVMIDQLQDPQNLGAILRSCEAVGVDAVILPKDGSVSVTPSVEAAAAGAGARMRVCRVTNLARTIEQLKRSNLWIVGLGAEADADLFTLDVPDRLVLVVGGETGLRKLVSQGCDLHARIPMFGTVQSLNASVATAVALYELRRRRSTNLAAGLSKGTKRE